MQGLSKWDVHGMWSQGLKSLKGDPLVLIIPKVLYVFEINCKVNFATLLYESKIVDTKYKNIYVWFDLLYKVVSLYIHFQS